MAAGVVRAYALLPVRTALGSTGRMAWWSAAALMAALSLVAEQELAVVGARLSDQSGQSGTVYVHQLSAPMLTLVSDTALPLVPLAMGMDLLLRREVKRHCSRDAGAALSDDRPSRHKKRHRINHF